MSLNTENLVAMEFRSLVDTSNKRQKIIRVMPIVELVVMIVVFSILDSAFISFQNIITIITQMAIPLIIAIGIVFVVLVGGIDLSADGVTGLGAALISLLVLNNRNKNNLSFLAIIIVLIVGLMIGFITGLIHVKGKIPSFMVTFGMLSVTTGIATIAYGSIPVTVNDENFRELALYKLFGLPIYVYISLAIFLLALFIQYKTAFGKYMMAIGENESLTRVSGVNTSKVKITVFMWSAMLASMAGILWCSQIGRGDVEVGTGQAFQALAAIVLGGTSLAGGKGGVLHTLIGVIIITILKNGLILIGVNPFYQNAAIGIILIIAVAMTLDIKTKQVVK